MFLLSVNHPCKASTKGRAGHVEDRGEQIGSAGAFQPKPEQESGLKSSKQPRVSALNPKSLCFLAPFKLTGANAYRIFSLVMVP